MVTAFNIMFSKAAAAKVMCCAASDILQVRKFAFVAWVWVRGQRPRFVSLKAFKIAFVMRRMRAAVALKAEQWDNIPAYFTVRNEEKGSSYPVEMCSYGPKCECEDYRNQKKFFGKGVCKHGYAALGVLGYGSLGSYLEARPA